MCGITGFLHTSFHPDQWSHELFKMAKTMIHRGPDDEGVWFDSNVGVGLAHRRLAIIDLSREGHQPMTSISGRYVIVYNGEIYNFQLLRKSLKNENIQWRSHSDTEVILAAIESWGIETAVKHCIGMFAFALWDKKERILYLCRDRIGIKPLYYALIKNGMVFGSELKALKAHQDFEPIIDRNALALYLRYNCIPAPYCIFQNSWKLMPGHILKISANSLRKKKELPKSFSYWSASNIVEAGKREPVKYTTAEEAIERLEDKLFDAVKMRMISDVPLGCFLSGGVDSSTVASLMQKQSNQPIKTFTIGFHDIRYNEAKYAKAVANILGTEHTELYVSIDDAIDVIPNLPTLYDEPFSDSSQIPTFLLSKLTRLHVTVCLSGDGGDEIFGGYNRHFLWQSIWQKTKWMPMHLKKLISCGMKKISPNTWDKILQNLMFLSPERFKFGMSGDRIHKLSEVIDSQSPEMIYKTLISHWKEPEKIVINGSEPMTVIAKCNYHPTISEFTHQMMYFDLITYLPDDILTKIDRASMGVSLEARVPILDHRVVEFVWRLPLSMKVFNNQGKWILRQILYKYVPKELIERPKMGFAIPIDAWLRGPLRDWAETILDENRLKQEGFFDPKPIRNKWEEHLSGKLNWQYDLWDVLMFQSWLEQT
jgi:asparagine synthase (glutamine-hydrolysing)